MKVLILVLVEDTLEEARPRMGGPSIFPNVNVLILVLVEDTLEDMADCCLNHLPLC